MPFEFQIEVKASPINGKGIFAFEKIPKGQILWTYKTTPHTKLVRTYLNEFIGENVVYDEASLHAKTKDEICLILHEGYPHGPSSTWIDLKDGSQFINHSQNPNADCSFEDDLTKEVIFALRDIEAGEEITENYRSCLKEATNWICQAWKEFGYETEFFIQQ